MGYSGRTGCVSAITVPGLLDLAYTYSHAGDVLSILDNARGFSYAYQYDNLHRLTHETAVGPFYQPEDRSIALYYEGAQAHAVSRVVADTVERLLAYESNGNLTTGYDFGTAGQFPERNLDYDAENMPLSIEYQPEGGGTATTLLTYDGEGRRVKKQTGADTVVYVDTTYEIANGQPVKYVFAGNLRVAKVSGSTVHYFHKDHLGSSSVVTDATGSLVDSLIYEPYGQPRETSTPASGTVAYTYTDQEWDAETGLYNYDARLYDAVLGRFLTADSIVPDWHHPQALNRYAYALNNPLKYVDPDGHEVIDEQQAAALTGVKFDALAGYGTNSWIDRVAGDFFIRIDKFIQPEAYGPGAGADNFMDLVSVALMFSGNAVAKAEQNLLNSVDDAIIAAESAASKSGLRTAEEAGISPANATRIQNAANRTNQEITVVGSRAKGTANSASDWDYVMSGKSSQRHSASSSVPRGTSGGAQNSIGRETGIDVSQSYNPNAPGYSPVRTNEPHVVFKPE